MSGESTSPPGVVPLPTHGNRTARESGREPFAAPDGQVVDHSDDLLEEIEEESSESIGSQLRQPRTLISFGLAVLIVWFALTKVDVNPRDVWDRMREANKILFVSAIAVFFSSFVVRAVRWKMMLAQVGIDEEHGFAIPGTPGLVKILVLSWFANCVAPARLGDAYRGHLLKERSGASFGVTIGTILAERLIDLVVLVIGVVIGGFIVFGTDIPARAETAVLVVAGIVGIGCIGALVLFFARNRLERMLPDRFTGHFLKLHMGIFEILKRPTPYVGMSVVIWLTDGLRVLLVARSLGINLTFPESSVIGLLSAMVTISPITPAGLGVVESFMIWLLPNFDVGSGDAAAFALLDRFATYWILIIVGVPLYLYTLRHDLAAKRAKAS